MPSGYNFPAEWPHPHIDRGVKNLLKQHFRNAQFKFYVIWTKRTILEYSEVGNLFLANPVFQQNSVPYHTVLPSFQDNNVPLPRRPGNTSDFNPIENLRRRLKSRRRMTSKIKKKLMKKNGGAGRFGYHASVPMISISLSDIASTPLVEALLQTFRRRGFPKEIQTDEKLGTYYSLRMPFTLKNAFNYFSRGWDFPIDHMDAILERNMRLAVRPAEFELAQDGVEYCGYVVGLGKQSPAQLKVRAIIDFSISRGPSKNRTFLSSEKVLSRGRRSCGECSEEVGEKGLLESRSPTFRIDSSGKDKRRTGFEGPDWRQTA
ncbi:hypothetical protein TNCV_3321081 [Trichonephila clavipes]|nr:hypothetical protein TNCV_3321081 [Trichonephila clavipes]